MWESTLWGISSGIYGILWHILFGPPGQHREYQWHGCDSGGKEWSPTVWDPRAPVLGAP